ncbi:hypothetical protein CFK37_05120 [Virgibacillus phasianinus]|uniref:Uncharacterized protein n=1 Tax=Virgibacillus phasianinus TaxID=2017483 RepID=A0A220U0J3_9BACI|nr:hypothetical protein CFK37_05120 [Virgibacillus phasianinus]
MSQEDKRKEKNILKNTTNEANDLFHKTVDTANKTVKSVSGEGGLVGKASDTASNVLKNSSDLGNNVVGKSVDTSGKFVKGAKDKVFRNKNKKSK